MPWMWWALAAVLALLVLLAVAFFLRTRYLTSTLGVFECAIRETTAARLRSGWACYDRGRLLWFALESLSWRPRYRWSRSEVEILEASRAISTTTGVPVRAVTVETPGAVRVLVLHEHSYLGLVSWLESAPPAWSYGEDSSD